MDAPVVVVGAGLAGTSVARELRRLDPEVPVVVLSADRAESYAKPNLSNALANGKAPEQLVQASAEQWASRTKVEVRPGTRVLRLDAARSALETSAGTIPYSRLVLALGAGPIRFPVEGEQPGDISTVNSLDDYRAFRTRIDGARSVAILGGGLVGCEFADDLRSAGIAVRIFDPAPRPLGRLLPEQAGRWMEARLRAAGIATEFDNAAAAVERRDGKLVLRDRSGNGHAVDAVLSAVGLRPETALAREAGLSADRGIRVDRFLRTTDPAIFALGDCAEVEGLVLPFVQPVLHAARALARTLAGTETAVRYPAMPVVVKTPSAPAAVCPPPAGVDGSWQEEVSDRSVRSLFRDAAGALRGFALLGEAVKERDALAAGIPDWL